MKNKFLEKKLNENKEIVQEGGGQNEKDKVWEFFHDDVNLFINRKISCKVEIVMWESDL